MNSRGYTLLEVGLFLAISGALTLVALVGLAPRLRNVRFSTTMRDLQSNVAKQLSTAGQGNIASTTHYKCTTNISTGLDIQPLASGDPCVYVGKVAFFDKSSQRVEYHSIVAALNGTNFGRCSQTDPNPYDKSSLDYIIRCSQARLMGTHENVSTFEYPNQLVQDSSSSANNYGFGFVRNVDTDTVHRFVVTYNGAGSVAGDKMLNNTSVFTRFYGQNEKAQVCYNMSGRQAVLELSPQYTEPKFIFNQGGC